MMQGIQSNSPIFTAAELRSMRSELNSLISGAQSDERETLAHLVLQRQIGRKQCEPVMDVLPRLRDEAKLVCGNSESADELVEQTLAYAIMHSESANLDAIDGWLVDILRSLPRQ